MHPKKHSSLLYAMYVDNHLEEKKIVAGNSCGICLQVCILQYMFNTSDKICSQHALIA